MKSIYMNMNCEHMKWSKYNILTRIVNTRQWRQYVEDELSAYDPDINIYSHELWTYDPEFNLYEYELWRYDPKVNIYEDKLGAFITLRSIMNMNCEHNPAINI